MSESQFAVEIVTRVLYHVRAKDPEEAAALALARDQWDTERDCARKELTESIYVHALAHARYVPDSLVTDVKSVAPFCPGDHGHAAHDPTVPCVWLVEAPPEADDDEDETPCVCQRNSPGLAGVVWSEVSGSSVIPEGTMEIERCDDCQVYASDNDALAAWLAYAREQGWRVCRRCGCTDEMACNPPCTWVEADLCSTDHAVTMRDVPTITVLGPAEQPARKE
jgi:hypothetical protein